MSGLPSPQPTVTLPAPQLKALLRQLGLAPSPSSPLSPALSAGPEVASGSPPSGVDEALRLLNEPRWQLRLSLAEFSGRTQSVLWYVRDERACCLSSRQGQFGVGPVSPRKALVAQLVQLLGRDDERPEVVLPPGTMPLLPPLRCLLESFPSGILPRSELEGTLKRVGLGESDCIDFLRLSLELGCLGEKDGQLQLSAKLKDLLGAVEDSCLWEVRVMELASRRAQTLRFLGRAGKTLQLTASAEGHGPVTVRGLARAPLTTELERLLSDKPGLTVPRLPRA